MILKINPRDVVAIPADYNNTKGRCCRYEVIGEYTENWREKIGRGENGFDSDLYSSDGGDYESDEQEGEICDHCSEDLTDENYDGNGNHLCTTCYDEEYSGCYGGGCSGKTTNEDDYCSTCGDHNCSGCSEEDIPVENKNQYGIKPDGNKFHNVRDAFGRFIKVLREYNEYNNTKETSS
jgi:hypothetical protein